MFLYSKWLSVPLHIRSKIAIDFDIPKLRSTHVVDNVVKDDGYDIKMIEIALTEESARAYLLSERVDVEVAPYLIDLFNIVPMTPNEADKNELGEVPADVPVAPQEPNIVPLTPELIEQFKKEYEERTGKKVVVEALPGVDPDEKLTVHVISNTKPKTDAKKGSKK